MEELGGKKVWVDVHEYTHPHYIYVSMYFLCPQRQNGEIREGAVRRGPGTCDPCHEHVMSYMQYSFYIGPLSLFAIRILYTPSPFCRWGYIHHALYMRRGELGTRLLDSA